MVCLRCGYCCIHYFVAIVNDPEKGLVEGNIVSYEGHGPCKHLRGNKPGEYSCILHDKPWYDETPCFAHSQFERKESPCRIGAEIMKRLMLPKK